MLDKSLVDSTVHVWSLDPALDRKSDPAGFAEAWKKFFLERRPDRKREILQPFIREGKTPAEWTIVPLDRDAYLEVSRLEGLDSNCQAVTLGLRDVRNFKVRGLTLELKFTEGTHRKRLRKESLDALFDPRLVGELALAIVEISQIDFTHGQD